MNREYTQETWPRALQTSEPVTSSSTHTHSTSSSTNPPTPTTSLTSTRADIPFFQDPPSVTLPPSASQGHPLSKAVLEYILISAFIMICAGLLLHRIVFRRRRNTSIWPTVRDTSSTITDTPASPHRFPRTTGFTEVPPYPYARRTRAFDTDAAGRRIGGGLENSDHDGYIGDKDVLPAYDNSGGPPKYREMAHELDVMPSRIVYPGNNIVENAGTENAGTREPNPEISHQLSGSGNGNLSEDSETPTVPDVVHAPVGRLRL